jgi:hypothetical protein
MSRKKVCKVLHKIFIDKFEQQITANISEALRADFANVKAAESKLAKQADIKRETLKKWYYGYNAPSAVHLILLARSSPAVEEALRNLIAKGSA